MAICQLSAKFEYNPDYETAEMPSIVIKRLVKQSKGCFHIHNYLCLLANKTKKIKLKTDDSDKTKYNEIDNPELGHVVRISTNKIAKALGMKLRTVQQCLKDMFDANLLFQVKVYNNKENDQDIYITGYKSMYKRNKYIKLPKEVFEDTILKADKGTISLFLYEYSTVFKHAIAQVETKRSKNVNLSYSEAIHTVEIERDLKESTLLKSMKRISRKCLSDSHHKLQNIGLVFEEKLTADQKQIKFIVKAYSLITKLFKPKNENLSIIKKYPYIYNKVLDLIKYVGIENSIVTKKEFEDLTQMLHQYGEVPFMVGLYSYKSSGIHNENITNKCAYIRTCINTWLREEHTKEKDK